MRVGLACLLLLAAAPSYAQDFRIGGRVSTALQLRTVGCGGGPGSCRFLNFRNANVVGLTIEATPGSIVELKADVSLRNINFAELSTLEDTGDIQKVAPVDIRVNEARLTFFDLFGVPGLDLSGGALRVDWGAADGHNPTDIVNPYDLEDGTGFDERLTSLALRLAWSGGDWRIEAIMLPLFQPGILPVDDIDFTAVGDSQDIFGLGDYTSGDPPEITDVESRVVTPEFSGENIQAGGRVRYQSPVGDFALSFFRGFETLPQAHGAVVLTGFNTGNRVDAAVPLGYPRIMMAAFDGRVPVWRSLSIWAEVGVFFPERQALTTAEPQLRSLVKLGILDELPDPAPEQETQSDDVYAKAVVGLEYLFYDQLYVNLQYSRGLPPERQASDIHDYVLAAIRWTLWDGTLELRTRGGVEFASGDDGLAVGYQVGGAISYLHGDAGRLTIGTTFLGGADGTTFKRFETMSSVYLKMSMAF